MVPPHHEGPGGPLCLLPLTAKRRARNTAAQRCRPALQRLERSSRSPVQHSLPACQPASAAKPGPSAEGPAAEFVSEGLRPILVPGQARMSLSLPASRSLGRDTTIHPSFSPATATNKFGKIFSGPCHSSIPRRSPGAGHTMAVSLSPSPPWGSLVGIPWLQISFRRRDGNGRSKVSSPPFFFFTPILYSPSLFYIIPRPPSCVPTQPPFSSPRSYCNTLNHPTRTPKNGSLKPTDTHI